MKGIIYESELKVLELLWKDGDATAKELAIKLKESTAWSKTTSYTVIGKCVKKGLITRTEPDFMCRVNITREEARQHEATILIDKMFGGSSDLLIASLLDGKKMTSEQIDRLRAQADAMLTE